MSFWIPPSPTASSGNGRHDGSYSASSTYHGFFTGLAELWGAKELWSTKALPRVKLFFWLWTAERRKRHGLRDSDAFALCDQAAELVAHLFLGCVFAREVLFRVLKLLGLTAMVPVGEEHLVDWW